MHFEVPVFSATAAQTAAASGATRLEINRAGSYAAGGLTPSLEEVGAIRQALSTPVRIMIRPRGPLSTTPDFIYSEAEFAEMLKSITEFVGSGLLRAQDGFVFGVLENNDRLQLDLKRNRLLIQNAAGHECILHRAFDLVVDADPAASLQTVQDLGFSGVLTAGGPVGGAVEHVATLRTLVSSAAIEVIVGGGVRSGNMPALSEILEGISTPKAAFHSSCLVDAAAAVRDGAAGEVVDGAEAKRMYSIVSLL